LTDKLPIRPIVDVDVGNGLHVRSQVMSDKLLAVQRDRIRRVVGSLDLLTIEQLDRALLVVLGLAR
jgi:mRNA interferase MazF